MNSTSSMRAQSLASTLPLIRILHSPPVAVTKAFNCANEKNISTGLISEKVLITKQCVDISTQTDALSDNEQCFVNQLDAKVEVDVDEYRNKIFKTNNIHDKDQKDLTEALVIKGDGGSESDSLEDGHHILCRELCVLSGDGECNDEISTKSKNFNKCDNYLKQSFDALEIETCETSLDSESFLEPVECTCNAATQFNCDCDETLANCTYQERIIDYENFRIIEHVIDCAQESYYKHSGDMQCPTSWQDIKEENVDDNKDINFACRELVAFIGESYQIINNTHNSILHEHEQSTKKILATTPKILEVSRTENEIEGKEYYKRTGNADRLKSQSTNRNINSILDDNNNKSILEEVAKIRRPKNNYLIKRNVSANAVTLPFDQNPKIHQWRQKEEQLMSVDKNSTPSVALALKALKSKLTPLAPSFHPARKKLQAPSSATTTSSSMYAFEQTAIYYQQQSPPTNQSSLHHQQITTKLNEQRFHQYPQVQEEQQQQQIVPMFQRNKNCFNHQQHNFVTPSIEHQQHCIQRSDSLGGLPHIHLQCVPSSGDVTATGALNPSALTLAGTSLPQETQLYPFQVISLATSNLPPSNTAALGPQQEKGTISKVLAAVGTTPWQLLEASPVFIDTRGDFHTFCPTHGHSPLNTVSADGPGTPHGLSSFNLAAGSPTQSNIAQNCQNTFQLQKQSQVYASTPEAPLKINSTNRLLQQQQIRSHNQSGLLCHQQQTQHNQSQYQHQQQHQNLDSSNALCISGKVYRGPTTVQMVSQNRPATIPVSVQVPQSQVMQQYVNESSPFAHVVLSPQYQQLHSSQGHMHAPFLTTNGTSHFYSPLTTGFSPGPGSGPTHFHALASGHVQTPQSTQQQQPSISQKQQTSSQQPLSNSPSPPNSYHKDERTQRQHTKLLRKLEKQRELNSSLSTPTNAPSPRHSVLNGSHSLSVVSTNSSGGNGTKNNVTTSGILTADASTSSSSIATTNNSTRGLSTPQNQFQNHSFHSGTTKKYDKVTTTANVINTTHLKKSRSETDTGDDTTEMNLNTFEDEEDCQVLFIEQLSAIRKPNVINVTSRSAKIIWEAPVITDPQFNIRELRYNVLFSDRSKDGKYKSLYKGDSFDCIVQDLLPGQLYVVRLQVHYEKLQGSPSDPTEFTTPPCEPDQPMPPKLVMRTKNSLHLRWTNPSANGSPIQHYLLEYDEGKSVQSITSRLQNIDNEVQHFVEATKTRGKHYTLTKLHPSTVYNFRLAAINEIGMSLYSTICSYTTSGNPPTAPKPPKLQSSSSTSLRLWWERRQQDGDYILQILDRESGHGYLNAYNGPDSSHECCQLRRATSYQFRLRAENEAGSSPWSNEVTFQTAPEKPGKPGKPHVKGKIHGTYFRVRWDPPADTGGAEILRYFLEITSGSKFERIYSGTDIETNCDRLQPGTTYQLRTSCEGPAGLSPYSDIAHITSEALVPAAPPPPYYDHPPGRNAVVLRLDKPDYNGGAPVLEFEVQMRRSLDVQFDIAKKANEKSIVYHGRDTYCMVKDLQAGSSYEVQVRVFNRIGAGPWSSWFRFSTAAGPPNAPHDLKVTVKTATHLFVTWEEPNCNGAPIIEYHLESLTGDNESESILEESSETRTYRTCYQGEQKSIDLRNLAPFTVYHFRVNATNTVGVSKWSTSVMTRTPAAVPAAPLIKDCEFTANKAVFNWTEPESNGAPITAYNIEYAENLITITNANTSYTISDLLPETTYKLRLQAINNIGPGPYSSYTKFTTLPSPPSPPVLECTGVGHNFVKLKWGDGKNLDFTKYYVEMFVQRAKEFQMVYSGTNCMCKVNKLQECTAYTFRIYASTDRAGIGDFSDEYTFKTTPTLPSSIKAPRIAMEGAAACLVTHSMSGASGFIPSGMLPETPTSFIAGLGNLSLGLPLTLEWQSSKNTFSDRIEYILQYAIGKDGDYKQIYRGPETKFTIENLEPGAIYQFRVCPIRVTMDGEDLQGQYTSPFRYQAPHFAALDDIDHELLGSMTNIFGTNTADVSGNSNGSMGCHGHSHMAHHVHSLHAHHSHNNSSHSHSHHNSRQSSSSLHHRSVSASAASSNSGANINGSSSSSGNTILIGPNAIGLIPLGTAMANELSAVGFANCEDPLHHHHHHHHHQFHGTNAQDVDESEIVTQTTASFLAATANSLLTNNPLLPHGIASVNPVQHGAVRRYMSKLIATYTNRKRFTDQEKAVLFMVCFLFFTFLFATLVKALMR